LTLPIIITINIRLKHISVIMNFFLFFFLDLLAFPLQTVSPHQFKEDNVPEVIGFGKLVSKVLATAILFVLGFRSRGSLIMSDFKFRT
jgi:hypothetical protein